MSTITMRVPLPPNMANARMHWRTKDRERKYYFDAMDLLQAVKKLPAAPRVPLSGVIITSTLHLGAAMDDDNAMARLKWPIDWLRKRGYIVDDKRTHCRIAVPEQVVKRDNQYHVELTVSLR